MNHFRIPANILLVGEYAVIEPGGLGVAAAVEPSVVVTVEPGTQFSIQGITGNEERTWSLRTGGDRFLEAAVRTAVAELSSVGSFPGDPVDHFPTNPPPVRITIDSTAFFDRDGNKLGFGSSASVVVALVRALCGEYRTAPTDLTETVVRVHRAAQNGRGSGYDVAASLHGGVGRFVGGAAPLWDPLAPPAHVDAIGLSRLYLFRGPRSVDTRAAIAALETFGVNESRAFAEFVSRSNTSVERVARAVRVGSWPLFRDALSEAAENARTLGGRIGVPAVPDATVTRWATDHGGVAKCVGAGDELTLVVLPPAADAAAPEGAVCVHVTMPEEAP